MKAIEILSFAPVNKIDQCKAQAIAESIKSNGWVGSPILVSKSHGMLITGSHRQAALSMVDIDIDSLGDIAEDVDDIIDTWCRENDACIDDIDFGNLSVVFGGTWVEQYKNDIEEW